MPRLTKAGVAFRGIITSLEELLKEWEPGDLPNETKYRDSLFAFLKASIPDDCRIEREYRHAGTTADIWLQWKGVVSDAEVFIEIKRDLTRKTLFDRLVGQIEGLGPGDRRILVILVGHTDSALLGRLRDKYRAFLKDDEGEPMSIVIVE